MDRAEGALRVAEQGLREARNVRAELVKFSNAKPITTLYLDDDGNLVAVLADGSIRTVGNLRGPPGHDGQDGASVIGPVGPKGDVGERGERGLPGSVGPRGEKGEAGPRGGSIIGPIGPAGAKGERGEIGLQGIAGERGLPGRDGLQGERGERGEPGPQGLPGFVGKDGLRGEVGPVGPQGQAGLPGPPGSQGSAGLEGKRGQDGSKGEEGKPGPRGEAGPQGHEGPPGQKGDPGSVGPRGEAGPQGREGPQGRLPLVKAYEEGTVYYRGDCIVADGSLYQAQRDTGRGVTHADWICLARAGRNGCDGKTPNICGTYNVHGEYQHLDIVAMDGAAFIAKCDDPGLCPGDNWQLLSRQGRPGRKGDTGDRGMPGPQGPKGESGADAPYIVSFKLDRPNYRFTTFLNNGAIGPELNFREAFEQFLVDVGGGPPWSTG